MDLAANHLYMSCCSIASAGQVCLDDLDQLLSDVEASWQEPIRLSSLASEPPRPQFSVLRPAESPEELGELVAALVECAAVLPPTDLEYHTIRRIFNKARGP